MDEGTKSLLYVGADIPELNALFDKGWIVHKAQSPAHASAIRTDMSPDVGLVYIDEQDTRYLQDLEEFLLSDNTLRWVAILKPSLVGSSEHAEFIDKHCEDYHTVPIDLERLAVTLGHAYGMAKLREKVSQHDKDQLKSTFQMYGDSPQMRALFRQLEKVAKADSPVLLTGESGTGKELVARAIHQRSCRNDGPFVAVNCGALPEKLIQSELFGHERGAFTGAVAQKIGKIEAASGGTIFLDEIGDLPYEAQVNLLRFLQEGTIERVGSTETTKVDVRILAATHIDLEKAIKEERFREDLFYRLNVLILNLPPLREREGDVELLARVFFRIFAEKTGCRVKGLSKQAMRMMRNHTWPGNVRELINRIQRSVVMAESRLITPADLGLEKRKTSRTGSSLNDIRYHAEKQVIMDTLSNTNHNVTEASRILGISRVTLYRLMEKYRLTRHRIE
jgi:DNA-binding NtrC family response regulator